MGRWFLSPVLTMLLFLGACATAGPVAPEPPSVQVTQFDTLLFTPDIVKFEAKVVIMNSAGGALHFERMDFGAEVNDKPMFSRSFRELKAMEGGELQTVTVPFQIAVKDFRDQMKTAGEDRAVTFSFRGTVFPAETAGLRPIPFSVTRTIPLPLAPTIAVAGTDKAGAQGYTLFLKITNPNAFPLRITSMTPRLELQGEKFPLVKMQDVDELEPGASATIAFTMEQSASTVPGLALYVSDQGNAGFSLGGDITCDTPYGPFYLPLKLQVQAR